MARAEQKDGKRQRIRDLIHPSGGSAQHTVHKPLQIVEPSLLGKAHRFIDNRAVRNAVHILQLIDAHAKNVPDHRFHIMDRNLGKALDDIINLDQVFQSPLRHAGNKRPVSLRQILVLLQRTPQHNMAVRFLLRDFHQDAQNNLSQIHCPCHNPVPAVCSLQI